MTVTFYTVKYKKITKRIRQQDILTIIDNEDGDGLEEDDDDAVATYRALQDAIINKFAHSQTNMQIQTIHYTLLQNNNITATLIETDDDVMDMMEEEVMEIIVNYSSNPIDIDNTQQSVHVNHASEPQAQPSPSTRANQQQMEHIQNDPQSQNLLQSDMQQHVNPNIHNPPYNQSYHSNPDSIIASGISYNTKATALY